MSAIQPTISTVGKVSLSIRLERAAAAVCVVYSTAAVSGEGHGLGRLDDVSGSGAFSTGLAQDFSLVSIHSSHQNSVLCGLGSGQAQAVVLLLQGADVVCVQRIENSTAVSVLVLNHITGGVLDSVLDGASVGCVLILHAINGTLGSAAAVSNLVGQGVDASLGVVAVLQDCGVDAVETLTQSAVNAVNARQNRIGSESSGQISLGSRSATAGIAIAALTATKATAEAVATTAPAEQQKDDNPILLS